jgi:diguanylate cyclase (GGDEF)-like protein
MQTSIKTLLEQMRITDTAITQRMELLSFTDRDAESLAEFAPFIAENLDSLVDEFYRVQTSIPEIALLIGDLDTFKRLQIAQRKYVLDLFSGLYDLEYVNNRLRIGLVHKRIGVEPRLYLSATHLMRSLLVDFIVRSIADRGAADAIVVALDKLIYFDVTLVVETYIRSMLSEIETEKHKSEQYAQDLEDRSRQLENLSRVDPLTGLLNRRSMTGLLARDLVTAQRQSEAVSLVYIDIDQFKLINDRGGHKRGDQVLKTIGEIALSTARRGDSCFRVGGDEFCVILPHCDEDAALGGFCTRFQLRLLEHLPEISVSIGVHTTGPDRYLTATDLIERADAAMFSSKHQNSGAAGQKPAAQAGARASSQPTIADKAPDSSE